MSVFMLPGFLKCRDSANALTPSSKHNTQSPDAYSHLLIDYLVCCRYLRIH